MTISKSHSWLKTLQSLESVISTVPADGFWDNSALLPETLSRCVDQFDDHFQKLDQDLNDILIKPIDLDGQTQAVSDLIEAWHQGDDQSLPAMCAYFCENFCADITPDLQHSIMMGALLGEVEHDPTYHNNIHFRKVLLSAMRLMVAHDEIFKGTDKALNTRDMAHLLISACIHDIGHDGLGNTIRGVFYQGRLEHRSYELSRPYLTACGLEDSDLAELRPMILATDVTPLNDPGNPMNQMKAAYRAQFMGEETRIQRLNLDQDFTVLESNAKITLKALLLHEADIATSAGLTYDTTKNETILLMEEILHEQARPSDIIDFLKLICNRRFLSDAGQKLYSSNMARIYALAEQAVKEGNQCFMTQKATGESDAIIVQTQDSSSTIN